MTLGRASVSVIAGAAAAIALAGCAQSGVGRPPALRTLPLLPGSKVVAQVTQCDQGKNAYCTLEAVVVDPTYRNSTELVNDEHDLIHSKGWAGVTGDIGNERAALSPGEKIRVTYGTADSDLRGIDLGWIHRSRMTARALSRTLFAHRAAMSVMLETGPSA